MLSEDSIVDEGEDDELINQNPIENIHEMLPSGMRPHKLILKVNANVILFTNSDTPSGFCNGTRLIVKEIKDKLLFLEILCIPNKKNIIFLPRFYMQERNSKLPFKIRRVQFPIRLSYAMTINKSQGQTFDHVGIHLIEPVITHGQFYVEVSRLKKFDNVKFRISLVEYSHARQILSNGICGTFTKNIVYRSFL